MTALSNAVTLLLSSRPAGGVVKTFLRGALAAAPVWAAVALVFPAGEAQAQAPGDQRNQCAAISSGNNYVSDCTNQAYPQGVQYDSSDLAAGGYANDIRINVRGGSATTITSAAPAASDSWGSGIVLRTAVQGSGITTTRDIVLNAGVGDDAGNAIAIIQRSSVTLNGANDNTGVVVHQLGGLADTTTVRLGSGVTIGSATTAMMGRGIYLLSAGAANTGAQTIESAATIHTATEGIFVDQRGRGNVAVTNSGSISANSGTISAISGGIRVLDDRAATHLGDATTMANLLGSARLTTTTSTVTNSGAITVASASADDRRGIEVAANGLGRYRVVNTGTITTNITGSGEEGHGVYIDARWHRGHAENDDIQVESSGEITVTGEDSAGIYVLTSTASAGTRYTDSSGTNVPQNFDSSGDIEVVTTGGEITASATGGVGIRVIHDVASRDVTEGGVTTAVSTTASIENAAAIKAADYGILMDTRSPGDATVTNSGAVEVAATTGDSAGIRVWDGTHDPEAGTPVIGGGRRTADTTVKVVNSGAVSGKDDPDTAVGHGIWVDAHGLGRYEIVHGVASEEAIEGSIAVPGADAHGIFVDADYHAGAADSLAVKVTSSVPITASGANGIGVYVRNSAIDGHTVGAADTPDANLGGRIEVTNSGVIAAKKYAIAVEAASPGAITIANSGELTVDGDNAHYANVRDDLWLHDTAGSGIHVDDAGAGNVAVSNSADIAAAGFGVVVRKTGTAGNIAIGHSAGDIEAGGQMGILAAIGERTPVDHAGDIDIDVTGGLVQASESRVRTAVEAATYGTGSIDVNIGKDATLASSHGLGLHAFIGDVPGNTEGRIALAQAGTIRAPWGVVAAVERNSGAGETRNADRQPVIDITWTGTYRTAAASGKYETNDVEEALQINRDIAVGRFWSATDEDATGERGISAEVLSWRKGFWSVARADDPDIADGTAANAILDSMASDADGANYALKTAILPEIRKALDSELYTIRGVDKTAIDTDGEDGLSDAEIVAWLKMRDDRPTIMKQALQFSLSDEEEAVFQALVDGDDPKAAVDALQEARGGAANLPAGYYNSGDIRVRVNGGSIDATGDGVRVGYVWPDDRNGRIDLTVAEGATVTGDVAGLHLANAGMGAVAKDSVWGRALYLGEDTMLRQQFVTVHGTVTGGTDAAVHLVGGGALLVGEKGRVLAGSSGRAVRVNDPGPAEVVVHGTVRGGRGDAADADLAAIHLTGGGNVLIGANGRVEANGARYAIRGEAGTVATRVYVQVPSLTREAFNKENAPRIVAARLEGKIHAPGTDRVTFIRRDAEGRMGGELHVSLKEDGGIDPDDYPEPPAPAPRPTDPTGEEEDEEDEERDDRDDRDGMRDDRPSGDPRTFNCDAIRNEVNDRRCSLYEALPSVLLAMNALPGYDERMSATRDANGGWALVEGSSGEWKAAEATQPDMAYDLSHYGVRAGVELAAGDRVRLGVSAHHRRATAEVDLAGDIELSGSGAGVNATFSAGGFYADAQAAVTWFDAEIAAPRGVSESDGDGVSYAAALETGMRIEASDVLAVTPRASLAWSDASLDSFIDMVEGEEEQVRVSVEAASALTGRIGVHVEAAPPALDAVRLFGAADVSHLLSQETEARILDKTLKATSEETSVRAALGVSRSWDEGFSLSGAAHYAASGGDNAGFGGTLSIALRF